MYDDVTQFAPGQEQEWVNPGMAGMVRGENTIIGTVVTCVATLAYTIAY
jgi:hypothetical protein